MTAPEHCANCGATIPRSAKACPECGADERTGWRDTSIYDGLDLPDAAWRDESATGQRRPTTPNVNGLAWYWWIAGALLLALLILGIVRFG